ncbi:hypothetical protein SynSYN20_00293 [Synechococcus sp. SYN20]|nr:hypothetical protein SynSYN20_00293 [Synechococcus sp. SYN20]
MVPLWPSPRINNNPAGGGENLFLTSIHRIDRSETRINNLWVHNNELYDDRYL